jgi:virginiamycin A acetyltransferase
MNDVWIGHSVTILSGVTIENGAVIGACSVLTKSVGPYEIWAGHPARFIKRRFSQDVIDKLLVEKWWDKSTEEIIQLIPMLTDTPNKKR